MTTIHLATSRDAAITGYEADVIPRVGEVIKMPRDGNEYEVLKVTHMLVEPTPGIGQDLKLQIVHCNVKKASQ